MNQLLVKNIGLLVVDNHGRQCLSGAEMKELEVLKNAWLLVEDGKVKDFGNQTAQCSTLSAQLEIDANGGAVLPSFCDSHTHLVYADSREGEFVDKIRGLSYAEIARRGGGILNSADRLHELSEDELYRQAMRRIDEIIRKGTGAVEIKSGYGLNIDDELKMLRVIRRIRETTTLKVMATFLGAHAVGRAFAGRQGDYVDHVINDMIPEVGRQGLADFIDVFCDEGFFTPEETARMLEAGLKWGMRGKIHGQELADSGGVDVAVRYGALSVDHLESMTDRDIHLLKSQTSARPKDACYQRDARNLNTIPTALPGTSFFLNMPFAPGRKMIDAGLPLATASDYNPGSTPSGDMKFVVSLACIKMRLLPEEAINAATLNTAAAMGLSGDYGSLARGKVANFYITEPIPSIDYIPYAYTQPIIRRVFLQGKEYARAPHK
ncbi:MAG: imidazolonepropionase [Prevotella sp.]|nr:imidazolonepropionase [Prevotella sp.]